MTATSDITQGKLHDAGCGIWDIPAMSGVEQIFAAGYQDEATAAYLSQVTPLYAAQSRILAQLSGVLLLALATPRKSTSLDLDHAIFTSARDQLSELQERLRALHIPPAATRHHRALQTCADHLSNALRGMESLPTSLGTLRDVGQKDIIRQLHYAQRLLIATAEPDAQITPVDLSHACCSCAVAATSKQSLT